MTVDLGTAMLNAVQANSPHLRVHGDKVEFQPWWRVSDSLSGVVFPSRATWADVAGGTSGGARDLAAVMGLTLRQLLDRYGEAAPHAPLPASPPASVWQPGEAAATWERHREWCAAATADADDVRAWLGVARGLPGVPPSGVLRANAALFPEHTRAWVARVLSSGPSALVPMRCVTSRAVEGLVLRPFTPRRVKSLSVRGLGWRGEGCLTFGGVPMRGETPRLVMVCEGAPDAWTLECLLEAAPGQLAIVLGVNGVGQLPRLASWLATPPTPASVVLVPQADRVNPPTSRTAVATLTAAGVHAAMLRWPVARGHKDVNDLAQAWRGEWAELAQSFADALRAMSMP